MIGQGDRQTLVRDINEAHRCGARLKLVCETAGDWSPIIVVTLNPERDVLVAAELRRQDIRARVA